jgi:glutamate racemase
LRVGIFDSGIGGLSVAKSIIDADLFEEIIYFGDTARVPYGIKNEETIIKYSLQAVSFFERKNVDLLICACNSVSAWGLNAMQEKASFDVLGVIDSGILAVTKNAKKQDNILILGTKATIRSKKYENKLNNLGYKNVISLATPLFVPIVEEG